NARMWGAEGVPHNALVRRAQWAGMLKRWRNPDLQDCDNVCACGQIGVFAECLFALEASTLHSCRETPMFVLVLHVWK
ncbi:hypothetical protein M3P05_20705, partial [Sansalvadorimonas sp. 2012CJ34-2]